MQLFVGLMRFLSVSVGLFILGLAIFVYEDEEKRLQNRLEEWWIRIDDLRSNALTRHAAFMRTVASVMTQLLDWLYGIHLVSIRAAWPGLAITLAIFGLIGGIFALTVPSPGAEFTAYLRFQGCFLLVFSLGFFQWGVQPAKQKSDAPARIGFVVLASYLALSTAFPYWDSTFSPNLRQTIAINNLELGVAAVSGMTVSLLVIAVIRFGIRKCAEFKSVQQAAIVCFALLACCVGAVLGPFLGAISLGFKGELVTSETHYKTLNLFVVYRILVATSLMDFAAIWPLVAFLALLGVMLLHRLVWSAVERPLYAAQRHGLLKNTKVLATCGLTMIAVGGGPLVASVVGSLANIFSLKP